jgi:hypothetical protein
MADFDLGSVKDKAVEKVMENAGNIEEKDKKELGD